MRKALILCGLILFAAGSAFAQDQPRGEVAGYYTYIRINPGGGASSRDCDGGGGSFAVNLNNYFGVVGEFAGCKVTGLPSGLSEHAFTYVFGPRLTYRGHGGFEPFAEALFGGAHFTISVPRRVCFPERLRDGTRGRSRLQVDAKCGHSFDTG